MLNDDTAPVDFAISSPSMVSGARSRLAADFLREGAGVSSS